MGLGKALHQLKDTTLAHALKGYINDRFGKYGEVLDCQVDTSCNSLHVRALLKGETEPVTASIDRYEIEYEGEQPFFVLHACSASREWLSVLLDNIAEGSRHKIPPAVARFL